MNQPRKPFAPKRTRITAIRAIARARERIEPIAYSGVLSGEFALGGLIKTGCNPCRIVLDPFCGTGSTVCSSGTTGIADDRGESAKFWLTVP
jgi:tRNA G10  N-methylase Trm11